MRSFKFMTEQNNCQKYRDKNSKTYICFIFVKPTLTFLLTFIIAKSLKFTKVLKYFSLFPPILYYLCAHTIQ